MPWIALLAPLGAAFSLLPIFSFPWRDARRIDGPPAITFERFVIWMALGCLIYFGYGMRYSLLERMQSCAASSRSAAFDLPPTASSDQGAPMSV